jgi:TRAP-type C4-dicarboxylate transport system permease small subunit
VSTLPEARPAAGTPDSIGRRLENFLLCCALAGMIVLATLQIVRRDLCGQDDAGTLLSFLLGWCGAPLPWADEALRLLVLWAAMLGAVAASRDDSHLRIDVLSRLLGPRSRLLSAVVVDLFAAAVAGLLAWYSGRFVSDSRSFEDVLLGDQPAWIFQLILPLAFGLTTWCYLRMAWLRLRSFAATGAPGP